MLVLNYVEDAWLLTWEDGYCDPPKPRESVESISDGIYFNETNENFPLGFEASTCNGSSAGYPIELAVANMSCLLYSLGEGYAYVLNTVIVMQTILLVPVIPHGVVQIGSLETVAEDLKLVAHIKDTFNALQYIAGTSMPLTSSKDLISQPLSSLTSPFLENVVESSVIISNLLSRIQSGDPNSVDEVKLTNNKLSTISSQVTPLFMIQDKLQVPGKDLWPILESAREVEFSSISVGPTEGSIFENQSTNANHSEMMGSNMFSFTCHGAANDTDHKSVSSFLSFPMDCELHKALGPAFQRQCNEYLWDSTVSGEDACSSLSLICHSDLNKGLEPSVWESNGWFAEVSDADLLEAVVTNVFDASDNTASNISNSVRSTTTSSEQFAAACQTHSQSEGSVLVGDDSVPWSYVTSAFVASGGNVLTSSSNAASSFKSIMSTLIDEEQQKNGYDHVQSNRGARLSHVSKKKARQGNIQRPRPRDRQMIQERVKELRELVPHGAKCSIDALLDRTIKHMLFLRSVTNQAEKLRQCVHPEGAGEKKRKRSENKGQQNGASWAFDLDSELRVCPIVIEDLDHPGHMLIEMLCEEHGLFLEIAQVICHLEFTILKGTMESHSDKIWAHFVVEAPRGFQRMDIFWHLMQLLQRSNNPISSKF
ncbi:hypothetical protein HHK36_016332 [Tetracentron sinense]|uniref:BHLH domain-containing protein n=1 Tax=Tetracentron sinense TaxID=13715 RepID=A0A834Z543_TETSI|nr:hypothetical protein HHK36_016332 [Tetracentron sinense]